MIRSNDRRRDPCDGADRMKMPPPRPMPHGEPTTVGCELGSNTSPFDDGADGREVSRLAGAAAVLAAPGCLRLWSASASSAAVRLLDGEPLCADMVVHGAVSYATVSCPALLTGSLSRHHAPLHASCWSVVDSNRILPACMIVRADKTLSAS